MTETKKPKKIAYVRQGRSILTKLGCAQAGAKVTPDMISAGTSESQLTIWYREIRDENGTLELPKKLKTVLTADSKGQLTLEELFGDDPEDEPPGDESSKVDPPEDESPGNESSKVDPPGDESPGDESPKDESPGDEKSRQRGAKRKKK